MPADGGVRARAPRVVHLVPALFDRKHGIIGGGERYALELARHMAERVPTRLVSFGESDHHETMGALGIRVIGHPVFVRGQRTNPVALRMLSELRNADVIHCHQRVVVASSVMALAARATGRRVVVSDLGGGGWDISGYISTDRWYHRHLHISEYSRKISKHVGKPWADVIFGGVDLKKFTPRRDAAPNAPVLFVGRLLPHKGIHDLIRALPRGMRLELVGPRHDERYFEALQKLAEGKEVTFHSGYDDAALVEAYHRALCIVLPSVYQSEFGGLNLVPELLGQTLLEGMACGLPAICTDVASMPEVVEHGVTGWVVPPNDPAALGERLQWLRDHPDQAREMGHAGRRRVERLFTWDAVVTRCLAAYAA